MGSPFASATIGKIAIIAQNLDYTRAKGWELLRRDFGCTHITSYPYFVLYNRYSGLIRVFIYENEQHLFSSMAVKIQPVNSPYPATTASGDAIEAAPDKFLSTSPSSTIGKTVLAVSDNLGGSNRWSVVEFDPSFDPNIANSIYTGAGLQFTIYAVQNYALQASINGTTVSGSSPGLNFSPQNQPTTSGGNITFTAVGEKFTTFGKDLNDLKSGINSAATGISAFLSGFDPKSLEGSVKANADDAAAKTSGSPSAVSQFANIFGDAAGILTGGASVIKLAGDIIGLLSGGSAKTPAPAPVYTSVNLSLTGSLTLNDVAQTFILRVPGTIQTDGNNATYYKCPLGIFNLVSTPKADTVIYTRTTVNGANITQTPFVAYRMTNDDIPVSYFDGTGLDLVSVQAAIMGKVQANSSGKASYDPFAPNFVTQHPQNGVTNIAVNYMRPDLESGRLEVTFFDTSSAHLHLFQTPYVNLECIKGMSINVPKTTTVSLRVKAILKRKDDPANTPILYIQDYQIDPVHNVTLDATYRNQLLIPVRTGIVNPPFANYTVKPSWISDTAIQNVNYTAAATNNYADNSLTVTNVTVSPSAQGVVFQAGRMVSLEPGFVAETGSSFEASINNYGWVSPTCGTLQKQAFQTSDNCYNTTAKGMAQKPTSTPGSANMLNNPGGNVDSSVNLYPVPARESLTISGLSGWGRSTITVVDQAGKKLFSVYKTDESPTFQLNTAALASGVYFLEIQDDTKKLTRKVVIAR
jgi:hypothetical protein